jgi:conjugal transfer ATP-binding protein TraC
MFHKNKKKNTEKSITEKKKKKVTVKGKEIAVTVEEEEEAEILDGNTICIQDLFVPDGLVENTDYLILGSGLVRTYLIHTTPRMIRVGWIDEIFNAGDVDLSVYVKPASDRTVTRVLTKKETKALSQLIADRRTGNISRLPELEQQVADYKALRDVIQLGYDRLFYVTILITVHGADKQELDRRCSIVETVLARRGAVPRKAVLRQIEGLKAIIPTAQNPFKKEFGRNMTSGAAACCLPLSISAGGHSSGVMLGVNTFSGTPIFLDRFAGEKIISNPHLFVCGTTGSGKSVSMRTLTLAEGYRGIKTAYIDPEGEYSIFTEELGGKVIYLQPGKFSGINPLDVEPQLDEETGESKVNIFEKTEDVRALVYSVYQYYGGTEFGAIETALLDEAVIEEYRVRGITEDPTSLFEGNVKKEMPTLSSIQERLKKKPNAGKIVDGMKPLLSGGSLGLFDGQTSIYLPDVLFICVNLKTLESDFARFVAMCAILSWLWQAFAQPGGKAVPKNISVDEAWMFLKHREAAEYLEKLARRGRKHGCALTIATQRFEEFAATQEGRAVIESCASILVLKQEEHAAEAAVKYFRLADGCADILKRARPGQGILRTSGTTTAVQVQPAQHEWAYVETRIRAG